MKEMTNILITGYPRTGKTTLVMRFLKQTKKKCAGFYTEEIRNEQNIRIGFKVVGISTNQTGILAHVDVRSSYRVGKYNVNLSDFEKIALLEMKKESDIVIIDEIGKMELFSESFKNQLMKCLEQGNVFATITMKGGGKFVSNIKNRDDIELIELTKSNRNLIIKTLVDRFQ
ncbi:MAG: NTPase [Asgard group archaeon]|nr:NTPase [Asgard group archaeon]